MKKPGIISAILLSLCITGCTGNKQSKEISANNELITVDVTKNYPEKEIILQDFMDVEYIPLETTAEFITQGRVLTVGKNIVVIKNDNNDGDIFIFDRTGKGIRKINRRGAGKGEYTRVQTIALDEEKEEIFVNSTDSRKILVYDSEWNFKRALEHKKDAYYGTMFNFDGDNLICHDAFINPDKTESKDRFMIISKQDGSVSGEIKIPFEKSKIPEIMDFKDRILYAASPLTDYKITPSFGKWIITEHSADTIYSLSPDHNLTPLIARTPSIQSMNPEVFLFISILTDRYLFMEAVKKEYDFANNQGYPRTNLMYDKQEKSIFKYTVYNADYSDKTSADMNSQPISNEVATAQTIEAHRLVEAYEKGQLKGRLKEIAATMDEESNPVIMLIKHRK